MRSTWLLAALSAVPAVFALDAAANNSDSLIWGPYRSNLYFGMRPRVPQSLMTGLIWFGTQDYPSFTKARHSCEQGDNLESYTWTNYDAREGGTQVLKDGLNNVKVTTELLKVPGGHHGGSWAVRIKGEPLTESRPMRTSFIYYLGIEGMGGLELDTKLPSSGVEGEINFSGFSPDLDEFTIRIVDDAENTAVTSGPYSQDFADRLGKTHISGVRVPSGDIWKAKDVLMERMLVHAKAKLEPYQENKGQAPPDPSFVLQFPDEVDDGATLYGVQKSFDGPFQFDVFYESASGNQQLTSAMFDEVMPGLSTKLTKRFSETFPVPPGPEHDSLQAFSQALTSNIVGGVGYFYGRSIVDRGFAYEWDQEDDEDEGTAQSGAGFTAPRALLTATPSRSFFPRGFYWDEGFHLLHIGEWDNDLSLEILKDWINLIDDDGWVAREQILGEEARSKVPAEFQTQVPRYANPPTLTMAVTAYIKRLHSSSSGVSDAELGLDNSAQVPLTAPSTAHPGRAYLADREAGVDFLTSIYEPLRRHYDWFRRSQRGQLKAYGRRPRSRTEAYRWRGRSAEHVLTSGMDDYPRAPANAGELHLDLHCWMGFFSRTMREIAEFIGAEGDLVLFTDVERGIKDNLEDLHWNEEEQMYCDVGLDENDEDYFECNRGYLSLFPLMLELLPADSPHVGAILKLLRDPEHLWSPYGLRSLSASHELFGKGENYWKGPIWVQMNYLVLRALHTTYAAEEGPYRVEAKAIYDELRDNIIKNVHKEYERTGYVWEQYDATTGQGQRSHPFTGWTSMVSLIISEKY